MNPKLQTEGRLILNCCGGLGNQMFVYAAGRYFARHFGQAIEVVKPHAAHRQSYGHERPFLLNNFSILEHVRETGLLDRFFFSGNPGLKRWHRKVGSLISAEVIEELSPYHFHSDIAHDPTKKTSYLTGYWQASGYAQAFELELREEFRLRSPLQGRNLAHAERIQGLKLPVSLHVRRGDYAHVSHMTGSNDGQRVSNVLPPRYYERAIAAASQLFDGYTLVVFSDEPEEARKLLRGVDRCVFIEGNDAATSYEDLWLMSLCKHHVIANSSFSWWGAWLNPYSDKRVFAPRYWGNTIESYFPDLYPPGWTIIDNL